MDPHPARKRATLPRKRERVKKEHDPSPACGGGVGAKRRGWGPLPTETSYAT